MILSRLDEIKQLIPILSLSSNGHHFLRPQTGTRKMFSISPYSKAEFFSGTNNAYIVALVAYKFTLKLVRSLAEVKNIDRNKLFKKN
jgi:hypothetical protein